MSKVLLKSDRRKTTISRDTIREEVTRVFEKGKKQGSANSINGKTTKSSKRKH